MQADLPDDPLVRKTMTSLGPGARDATLDDVAAWIRQLEELCDSKDVALAPASFRTDIRGSCRSTSPQSGNKPSTAAQTTKMQTKALKGYPPLPELHMEKVSSKKKNARGEAKLRLSVDRGPVLVLLTITDLDGATRTLRAVTADDNDLIPIMHPVTTIEATVIPFTPDQLLERLRLFQAKVKEHLDGVKYWTHRFGGQILEYALDSEKETVTMKWSGCSNPNCDCTAAPATATRNFKTGETGYTTDGPQINDEVPPMVKSFLENPRRHVVLSKRVAIILKEGNAIREKLPTAKPAEKKRLLKELEKKKADHAKLIDFMIRTAKTGGWLRVPKEELNALFAKAMQKDPNRVEALGHRDLAALTEYNQISMKLESTSKQAKKNRLTAQLVREEIEFDEAMNDIAAIAAGSGDEDGGEQEDCKELNDVSEQEDIEEPNDDSILMNDVLALVFVFLVFVFTWASRLSVAYYHLS